MSEYQSLLENDVRPKLESTFGKAVAMMIIASASNKVNAPMMGITKEHYIGMCDVICQDQRVIDMWGASTAAEVRTQWKQAAP